MEEQNNQYENREIICTDCKSSFTFSVEEQQFYQEKGLDHEPKRCKPCRVVRKTNARTKRSRPTRGNRAVSFHPKGQPQGRRLPGGPLPGQSLLGRDASQAPVFKADFGPSPWERPDGGSRAGKGQPSSRPRYDAVCTDCHTATQVPFKPNGVQPVYCRLCLPQHRTRRSPKRPLRARPLTARQP